MLFVSLRDQVQLQHACDHQGQVVLPGRAGVSAEGEEEKSGIQTEGPQHHSLQMSGGQRTNLYAQVSRLFICILYILKRELIQK